MIETQYAHWILNRVESDFVPTGAREREKNWGIRRNGSTWIICEGDLTLEDMQTILATRKPLKFERFIEGKWEEVAVDFILPTEPVRVEKFGTYYLTRRLHRRPIKWRVKYQFLECTNCKKETRFDLQRYCGNKKCPCGNNEFTPIQPREKF